MLPIINERSFMECTERDLTVLIDNPDYRENLYLDYKRTVSFLNIPKEKTDEREKEITEFRNDVCQFANTEGGFLIIGISDNNGLPNSIEGISIPNGDTDKFELNLRSKLNSIMPKRPPVTFHFVALQNGLYVVVILIEHDYYAPYIHLEKDSNYKIYKRDGNGKCIIGYTELKNMFIKSRTLENEIALFRKACIQYYRESNCRNSQHFMLYHIIPESFLNERKNLYALEQHNHIFFRAVFATANIDSLSFPCVDGLRFFNTDGEEEALLYDNGVAEYFLPLGNYLQQIENGYRLYSDAVWQKVDNISQGYREMMPGVFGNQRYFGCISLIGCSDVVVDMIEFGKKPIKLDRNEILCHPVSFSRIDDSELFFLDLKKLHLEYLLSVGAKDGITKEIIKTIEESQREISSGKE